MLRFRKKSSPKEPIDDYKPLPRSDVSAITLTALKLESEASAELAAVAETFSVEMQKLRRENSQLKEQLRKEKRTNSNLASNLAKERKSLEGSSQEKPSLKNALGRLEMTLWPKEKALCSKTEKSKDSEAKIHLAHLQQASIELDQVKEKLGITGNELKALEEEVFAVEEDTLLAKMKLETDTKFRTDIEELSATISQLELANAKVAHFEEATNNLKKQASKDQEAVVAMYKKLNEEMAHNTRLAYSLARVEESLKNTMEANEEMYRIGERPSMDAFTLPTNQAMFTQPEIEMKKEHAAARKHDEKNQKKSRSLSKLSKHRRRKAPEPAQGVSTALSDPSTYSGLPHSQLTRDAQHSSKSGMPLALSSAAETCTIEKETQPLAEKQPSATEPFTPA